MTPIVTCFLSFIVIGAAIAIIELWRAWRITREEIEKIEADEDGRRTTT